MNAVRQRTISQGYGEENQRLWGIRLRRHARRWQVAGIVCACGAGGSLLVAAAATSISVVLPLIVIAASLFVAALFTQRTSASSQRIAQEIEDRISAIRQTHDLLSIGVQRYGWHTLHHHSIDPHVPVAIVFSADRRHVVVIGVVSSRTPSDSVAIRRANAHARRTALSLERHLTRVHRPDAEPRVYALVALPLAEEFLRYDSEDNMVVIGGQERMLTELARILSGSIASLDSTLLDRPRHTRRSRP